MKGGNVIEADERDIAGGRSAFVLKNFHQSYSDFVRAREYRCCRMTFVNEPLGSLLAEADLVSAFVRVEAGTRAEAFTHGALKASKAVTGADHPFGSANKQDAAVPVLGK